MFLFDDFDFCISGLFLKGLYLAVELHLVGLCLKDLSGERLLLCAGGLGIEVARLLKLFADGAQLLASLDELLVEPCSLGGTEVFGAGVGEGIVDDEL